MLYSVVFMDIRPENSSDASAIHAVTQAAFAPMAFSDGTESDAIDGLRKDGDLTLSLVALEAGQIVGHVAFSPATIDGTHAGWFGLGPVSVSPALQRSGIGSALITEGLSRLKALGAVGCALIGNPAYYHRFGFQSCGNLTHGDLPTRLVQWITFSDTAPRGELLFSPALQE